MAIKPNEDGTYTLYCCNGATFTGTYWECRSVVNRILSKDKTVLALLENNNG